MHAVQRRLPAFRRRDVQDAARFVEGQAGGREGVAGCRAVAARLRGGVFLRGGGLAVGFGELDCDGLCVRQGSVIVWEGCGCGGIAYSSAEDSGAGEDDLGDDAVRLDGCPCQCRGLKEHVHISDATTVRRTHHDAPSVYANIRRVVASTSKCFSPRECREVAPKTMAARARLQGSRRRILLMNVDMRV